MKDKLTREEVLHVAHLARIALTDQEIEKYQIELKQIMDEIDKIKTVTNYDDELLIAPIDHNCCLHDDKVGDMLNQDEIMKNVPKHNGNFVEVPVMLNE